jgi:hypothetical protein
MARAIPISIALQPELRAQLDQAALEDGISRGEFLRRSLLWELRRREHLQATRTGRPAKRDSDAERCDGRDGGR